MGSVNPPQGLNLNPNPTLDLLPPSHNSTSTSAPTPAFLTPKKEPEPEPEPEPLDETDAFPSFNAPFSPSPPYTSDGSPRDDPSVFSEFHRVSELFRTSFSSRHPESMVLDPDSGAIVPVPPDDSASRPPAASPSSLVDARQSIRRKTTMALVRATELSVEGHRYFRDVVRRRGKSFAGVRILSMAQDGNRRHVRGDMVAWSAMSAQKLCLHREKRIVGAIPGVKVGDFFMYRAEMMVVGLHCQPQAGIDYLPAFQSPNGEPIATSIVVSGGYEDDEDAGDVIIYSGHGGQDKFNKQCADQKLEGGNLAMERSMRYGIEVRVIRGIKHDNKLTNKVYVYDGLYKILDCWFDVGKSGFGVYKYKLVRMEGQPEMGSAIMRHARSIKISPLSVRPEGILSLDLSLAKESVPVLVFNDIDNDNEPLRYEYLVSSIFPPFVIHSVGNSTGCECVSSCGVDCFCLKKNGGEMVYDQNGFLLKGRPMISECGPFCKCPPFCHTRVTQKGMKHRLEIFRSREVGWGVRSLDLIPAGAFVCEYAGIVLTKDQAQIFAVSGDSLINPGRFTPKWEEWGDISDVFPDYVRPPHSSDPPLDFAMDVSKMRNVACYISHSSVPNVMVQNVLYEHSNLCFPHLMLFAMENIPPMGMISLDYGVSNENTGKPLLLTG
ncbi:hypothetical protein MLD38_018140 [Melastoma candidum]|uniref:Uncharacterized protein n=1 Tax=Melastoma candidum TaxID=119954 RepID=A0ACB9QW12_9MYRT|nr:hypothetical protein MLD38_018140 [Melastoma candidum]